MIPRGTIDIGWTDLLAGLWRCASMADRNALERRISGLWRPSRAVACLSVRTGLDLLLTALDFPEGSEIAVSDVNIPDMFSLLRSHGMTPLPVPVDAASLSMDPAEFEKRISARTKAVLAAHLFGSRMPMEGIVRIAREHGLLVIEDCAQAFDGIHPPAHPAGDVAMYSFGLIKTLTALSGGILLFRDRGLADRVEALNAALPCQPRAAYARKIAKTLLLKSLCLRPVYSLVFRLACALGTDADARLSGMTRGFPGAGWIDKIRFRPSVPLLFMLFRRLRNFSPDRINGRAGYVEAVTRALPDKMRIGAKAVYHRHWVFPVKAPDPDRLVAFLRSRGIDSTRKASSLAACGVRSGETPDTALSRIIQSEIVYLPVFPSAGAKIRNKIIRALQDFPGASGPV